jgi:hypothetical protein
MERIAISDKAVRVSRLVKTRPSESRSIAQGGQPYVF